MEHIKIRQATLQDIAILLNFEQGVVSAERPFDQTLKEEGVKYYDLEEMIKAPHIEILVAELNNQLIASGYARIEDSKPYLKHEKHAYLGFMYVDSAHRGKGINQKIMESLTAWAKSKQITELRLDVYNNNLSAIKAYEKIGFSKHLIEMRMEIA